MKHLVDKIYIICFICIYNIPFTPSSVDGQLHCLQLSVIFFFHIFLNPHHSSFGFQYPKVVDAIKVLILVSILLK